MTRRPASFPSRRSPLVRGVVLAAACFGLTVGAGCGDETEPPLCGDGVLDADEQCDDGNLTNGDGCSFACSFEVHATCGDGVLDTGEDCDDGNTLDGDGCASTCSIESNPS